MLEIKHVTKIYEHGELTTKALDDVSLSFYQGEFVGILGPSGCGKTTFLNIIGGLDRYTDGDLMINGRSTKEFSDSDWDAYRNNHVGFVFQSYNLINHISIIENVELGMTLSGMKPEERKKRAKEVLTRVGLKKHMYKKSNQLSGGQKQRVAIARALANDPDVILADEPTGAIDSKTSRGVMELIQEIAKEKLVIMVTHNKNIANEYTTRIVRLKDGKVVDEEKPVETPSYDEGYEVNKTAMSFFTALKLSFNNLRTKLTRTLITAFAGSIGIIGVALVLAMSNGFQNEVDRLESETLSTLPITITQTPLSFQGGPPIGVNDDSYNETTYFDPVYESESADHYNIINDDYLDYLENIDQDIVSSIQYNYGVNLLMMHQLEDNTILNSYDESIFFQELSNNTTYLNGQYNVVAGSIPDSANEVVIVVDVLNRIDSHILEFLGFDPDSKISFDEVIGREIVVALTDDITFGFSNGTITQDVDQTTYSNGIPLTVSGVMKGIPDGLETETQGIYYHDDLELQYIEQQADSTICATLETTDTSDFSPDELNEFVIRSHASGCADNPLVISIYPESFDQKDEILTYLDQYNDGLEEDDQIIYTDLAATITGIMGSIISNISIVLVAFAAISLVVSSIMIGIITYVSVLERTKEIGILRSLGARKRDISRVFNAESVIVGFIAGIIGVSLTFLLSIPLNAILGNLLENFGNIIILRIDHALYLITVSILLTFIAGLIPSSIAANKHPVDALRHNE